MRGLGDRGHRWPPRPGRQRAKCGRDAIRLTVGALSGMTASTGDGEVVTELGVAPVAQPVDAGPRCTRPLGEFGHRVPGHVPQHNSSRTPWTERRCGWRRPRHPTRAVQRAPLPPLTGPSGAGLSARCRRSGRRLTARSGCAGRGRRRHQVGCVGDDRTQDSRRAPHRSAAWSDPRDTRRRPQPLRARRQAEHPCV